MGKFLESEERVSSLMLADSIEQVQRNLLAKYYRDSDLNLSEFLDFRLYRVFESNQSFASLYSKDINFTIEFKEPYLLVHIYSKDSKKLKLIQERLELNSSNSYRVNLRAKSPNW